MAQKPRIKGIPAVSKYAALLAFANNVISSVTGNLSFPTPSPTIATIQAAATALSLDITAWGPVGARGSHLNLMTMRADAFALRNLLVQLAGNILSTTIAAGGDYAAQSAMIVSSGFGVKNPGTPQGLLGVPQNFHQYFKNGISIYHVGLRWKKPVGLTSPGNVKEYQIYRSLTNDFATGIIIGTATRTAFIDNSPLLPAGACYYWVTASNAAGIGAPTASLSVNSIS